MQIVGQKANLEIINAWKQLPQFLIIQGDEDTGKKTLLLYMCEKFQLNYVKVKNGIKDVRELIKLMTPNSNTLYHFEDFDRASIQAKNALLKITEEPVVGNYIAITGKSQIKTLESRARKIVMNPYTEMEVLEYMQKFYDNFEMQKKLYIAGINTPAKVEKYSKYEDILPLTTFAFETFGDLTAISIDKCISIISSFEIRYEKTDACILFLTMLINIIEYNIQNKQRYAYYEILPVIMSAKESLERDSTLNRKFVLYRVFYRLYEMRGQI